MRLLLAGVFAITLAGLALADDDKKDEKSSERAERFNKIQKELNEANQGFFKEFQAAKTDKEKIEIRQKAMAAMKKAEAEAADKALALAAEDPKDSVGFDAAMFAAKTAPNDPVGARALDSLAANHLDNPKFAKIFPTLGQNESGRKALREIMQKATNKDTKGIAQLSLGSGLLEEADYPRGEAPLTPEKRAAAFKEAEQLLTQAAKDYGDVKFRNSTIAKEAEDKLYLLNNLTIGKTLPDAEVEDLEGKKVKVSDLRGKVVVLDIWATWCGPRRAMIPHERSMVKKLESKPFALISLSADEKKETLTNFLEKEKMPWTQWWSGERKGGALEKYGVHFFPTVYVLDAKGVIRYKHIRGEELEKAVEKLLAEGEKG